LAPFAPYAFLALLAASPLGAGGCDEDVACGQAVNAQPYDKAAVCLGASAWVGCVPRDEGCDDALTYAVDESGQCYQFSNSCVPARFSVVDAAHPACVGIDKSPPACRR
jgi:hypothetical protein